MGVHASKLAAGIVRAAFIIVMALAATTADAEFLRVTAANSIDNSVYDVTSFATPGTISPLNSDGSSHGSFTSLVHVANPATGTVDVLVADAKLGQIIRYTPAVGTTPASTQVVWSYTTSGSGPAHPDGLSVDAAGNLYIVTSKQNDNTSSAVWVLPASSTQATGYASTPLLIDANFGGANGVKVLEETAVATTTTNAWSPGDLLVLLGNGSSSSSQKNSNDADVLLYSKASIQSVLNNLGPLSGPYLTLISPSQFPAGAFPVGMDFWPPDSSSPRTTLLIATNSGGILRYDFTTTSTGPMPSQLPNFASNLGTGLQKLKVGQQLGVPYAFVSQTLAGNTGQILKLGAPVTPGTNNPIGAATAGVNSPDGLAVTRLDAVAASTCIVPSPTTSASAGCDISGGVIPHQLVVHSASTAVSGYVFENTCVVPADPRVTVSGGSYSCDSSKTLSVAALCPGFGNEIIPGNVCGASGASGSGFALIRTAAAGVDGITGILSYSQEDANQILPATTNLSCTQNQSGPYPALIWAPLSNAFPSEGSIVEVDPTTGFADFIDMTGYCDSSGVVTRGMSIYGVGLELNANALSSSGGLPGFAQTKYNNLYTTVQNANIVAATQTSLEAALDLVNTYLAQGDYACAADQVVSVDSLVGNDSPAANYPGNAANPNPWGEIRGRLANLYLTLNTRILGNEPNYSWPLSTTSSTPPTGTSNTPPTCHAPVVTLTATPSSIQPNTAATLTWSSQHAVSCTLTGGSLNLSGLPYNSSLYNPVSTGNLAATTSFTLSCTGAGGTTGTTATVTVVPPPQIGSFSASPTSVTSGGSSTLSWSATPNPGATCAIAGGSLNVSGLAASGSEGTGAVTATTNYTLTCSNSLGATTSAMVTVTAVPPPQIGSFSASPTSVTSGGSVTLSWSATAASCALSGGGLNIGNLAASGSQTIVPPTGTTIYALGCSNSLGATTSATVTVTAVPAPQIGSFSAYPTSVTKGGSSTLSWSATPNPGAICAITGGSLNVSGLAASGSESTGPISSSTTYTLACSNSLGATVTATTQVTVVDDDD